MICMAWPRCGQWTRQAGPQGCRWAGVATSFPMRVKQKSSLLSQWYGLLFSTLLLLFLKIYIYIEETDITAQKPVLR